MPTPDTKPRNRQQTKDRILTALQAILLRDGFNGVSITSVAHEAGVDKVLIYRYFGRIDDLLTAFGQHADFWPSVDEVLSPDNDILAPAERLASFFNRFVEALRSRPMTIEILAMEIGAPNPLTAALDATREAWGREVADRLAVGLDMPHRRLATIVTLLVCGIQFLGLRARATDTFGGIRIGSATGWQTIRADLAWLCDALLSDLPPHPTQPG